MKITKIPLNPSKDYLEGFSTGTNNMLAMVLTVFAENPEMDRDQIEAYIKDNL